MKTLNLAIAFCTCLFTGHSGLHGCYSAELGEASIQEADENVGAVTAEPVKFRRILSSQYANFPVNWAANHVYRLGLLRSEQEYNQVYNAAAFVGNRKPYAPAREIFEKEMIIVVSRVTSARVNLDKALEIDTIVAKGRTLEVTFTFREGPKDPSHSVKVTGAARIAKQEVERVVFFEGKKQVGELDVAQGQWLVPEAEALEKP